ncbi:MAG: polysaccharide deacetylase family protein [Campylobacteraceae bacterium]|nr:polysaccharide deacetylase family protein [Campylobacteraceae bacterium]
MYHHLNSDRCSNDVGIFEEHLRYISKNFTSVFPGEDVGQKSICLTFDDAYADFYFLTYPLLKKYNLKAVLAVPTKYILDDTDLSAETRMNYEHNDLFINYEKATFCTFKELKEMLDSGLVQIASHSHTHTNLLENGVSLDDELKLSKEILEAKLNIKVDSFFFPYGKYNAEILEETKKLYKYAFRIGNAVHRDFSGINGVIYRVNGDGLKKADEIFTMSAMMRYKLKALTKKISRKI